MISEKASDVILADGGDRVCEADDRARKALRYVRLGGE
jgi:hypothetical protein